MKKKIWLVAVVAAIGISWFVLANKFEKTVYATYLPILEQQKENGLVDLDTNNIKIHKYKFTVVAENFSIFPKSDLFQIKLDEISVFYNPVTRNISVYSSGKNFSLGSGETEVYIANPSFLCTINESFLRGNKDNFHITLNSKAQDLLRSIDNAVLVSDKGSSYGIMGNLDKKTNQYSLKLTNNTKGTSITRDYFKFSNQLVDKFFKVTQEDQKMKDFMNELSADYYQLVFPGNAVDSDMSFAITTDKSHLENVYKLIKGEIKIEELASSLVTNFDINKELFNIAISTSYSNSLLNNKMLFNLSGDGKEIKANVAMEDTKSYTKDKALEIATLTSEVLAKIFNKVNAENKAKTQELTPNDFINLASSLVDLKNINFSANVLYKIQETQADATLHFGINEYAMDFAIHSKNKESYNGIFTLSDPFKLINAKTKFAHEVLLPLAKKLTGTDKSSLVMMQKYISNVENNGFEALKVLNKTPELAAGDKFETDFRFEPKNFDFKINDKSFLDIITNEKIVKFLSGFSIESTQKEPPANQVIQEESVSRDQGLDNVSENNDGE
jgi:hypothetical protein